MATNLKPGDCRVSMSREEVFGNLGQVLQFLFAMGITNAYVTSVELPTPQKQENETYKPDSRNTGSIVKLGFEKGESTWDFEMLTAIFLYYGLGECVTTGPDGNGLYTHTLSESDTLPSFGLHIEQEHGSYPVRVDLLGCTVGSVELNTETGADTPIMLSVEIFVAKEIEGLDLPEPSRLEYAKFVRDNMSTFVLNYNSIAIEENLISQCDKHTLKIINEIDYMAVWNDEYPTRIKIGKRTYELMYHITTQNPLKIYNISKLAVPEFASQYGSIGKSLTGEYITQDVIASGGTTTDLVLTTGLTGDWLANIANYRMLHSGTYYTIVSYTVGTKTLVLGEAGPADAQTINIVHSKYTDVIATGGTTTDLILTTGLSGEYLKDIAANYLMLNAGTYYKIVSYTAGTKTLVLSSAGPADAQAIEIVKAIYYAGPIAMQTQLLRPDGTYVDFQLSKMRLDAFKLEFPSWEEKELEKDYTFKGAPGGVMAIVAVDPLDADSYEGS